MIVNVSNHTNPLLLLAPSAPALTNPELVDAVPTMLAVSFPRLAVAFQFKEAGNQLPEQNVALPTSATKLLNKLL